MPQRPWRPSKRNLAIAGLVAASGLFLVAVAFPASLGALGDWIRGTGLGQSYQALFEKYDLDDWEAFAVSGLAQGSLYALIALGYTLVYGILHVPKTFDS